MCQKPRRCRRLTSTRNDALGTGSIKPSSLDSEQLVSKLPRRLRELVMDMEVWYAVIHGVAKRWT